MQYEPNFISPIHELWKSQLCCTALYFEPLNCRSVANMKWGFIEEAPKRMLRAATHVAIWLLEFTVPRPSTRQLGGTWSAICIIALRHKNMNWWEERGQTVRRRGRPIMWTGVSYSTGGLYRDRLDTVPAEGNGDTDKLGGCPGYWRLPIRHSATVRSNLTYWPLSGFGHDGQWTVASLLL
jgi:hypothetical protein